MCANHGMPRLVGQGFSQAWALCGHTHPAVRPAALPVCPTRLPGLLSVPPKDGGQLEAAADMYRQALGISRRTLGEDHPDTASSGEGGRRAATCGQGGLGPVWERSSGQRIDT
jgi:hypothetical protein